MECLFKSIDTVDGTFVTQYIMPIRGKNVSVCLMQASEEMYLCWSFLKLATTSYLLVTVYCKLSFSHQVSLEFCEMVEEKLWFLTAMFEKCT